MNNTITCARDYEMKPWAMGERDTELIRDLTVKRRQVVAREREMTVNALNQWIYRIRQRKQRYRWYINTLEAIEKGNPAIKRMMLPTKISEEYTEE